MSTHAGVGTSRHRDPVQAGRDATTRALNQLRDQAGSESVHVDIALALISSGYAPEPFVEGLRQVVSTCPLAGCSAEGVITQDGSEEVEHVAAVLLVSSSNISFTVTAVPNLSTSVAEGAELLCNSIGPRHDGDSRFMLLLADGLCPTVPDLLRALDERLDDDVLVVGGTAGDALQFENTIQFTHDGVFSDGAVGISMEGRFQVAMALRHGCEPIGLQHEVTESDGAVVSTIDGRPAWDVVSDYFDVSSSSEFNAENAVFMSLAHRTDDGTVIRSPFSRNEETGALLFVGGIAEGTQVHMTHRTVESIRNSAEAAALEVLEKEPGRRPAMVLQFDCAGRGRLLLGELTTEIAVEPAQRILGRDIPWLGMHTFGEIAPVGSRTWFHNYTVVICAIYDPVTTVNPPG